MGNTNLSQEERTDIKEFVSTLLILGKEDRAILMSNANTLKTRAELQKLKDS
jgi:hypothetical protein